MQAEAPEAFDVSKEGDRTLSLYGLNRGQSEGFGWMNASFEVGLAQLSLEARRRLSQSLVTR